MSSGAQNNADVSIALLKYLKTYKSYLKTTKQSTYNLTPRRNPLLLWKKVWFKAVMSTKRVIILCSKSAFMSTQTHY